MDINGVYADTVKDLARASAEVIYLKDRIEELEAEIDRAIVGLIRALEKPVLWA